MRERKAPGPGRPKLPEGRARSKVLVVKLREDELEALRARARDAGLAVSAFVRRLILSGPTHSRDRASGPITSSDHSGPTHRELPWRSGRRS